MEEKYPVLKGAEPYYAEGGKEGVLVSHGFTGSTQSMRPLAEALAEAGYTVCLPRLKGHGTHYEDMERTSRHDWIESVEEGYRWLKERSGTIYMAGLSMGGTLTLYMAERHPDIRAIALINAAIDMPALKEVGDPEEIRFLEAIGSDIKKPDVTELAYEKTPVKSVKEILALMEEVRADLGKISCPALLLVSDEDHVVPPGNSDIIGEGLSSEAIEKVQLKNSYHVATLDNDKDKIIENVLRFFKEYS
ncbi:alpha/beta hydrolase [Bhargavaea beijingensis]|uniref:alpha/beta hydrolase n=1 Tax=Bhargavaea beijingensis TaxID=426756 RepID=UPI0022244899|nr:alpha/beta fold hydrolase [Bhargavaea beijingensis]MCW1928119.1 alpha/beta fold hydrolase [Bhargavaea beijingensis]